MSTWSIGADSSEDLGRENSAVRRGLQEASVADLYELLTVSEVAALLKVSRSWVYEHTRSRGTPRSERLPHIKIGKYVRFDPHAIRAFIERKCRTT
jgi:excisionase family DNA binding protein